MISNARSRRILALGLLALGGILLWLAPEDAWLGGLLLALGLALEIAGGIVRLRRGR
jgi:hypothetical protein